MHGGAIFRRARFSRLNYTTAQKVTTTTTTTITTTTILIILIINTDDIIYFRTSHFILNFDRFSQSSRTSRVQFPLADLALPQLRHDTLRTSILRTKICNLNYARSQILAYRWCRSIWHRVSHRDGEPRARGEAFATRRKLVRARGLNIYISSWRVKQQILLPGRARMMRNLRGCFDNSIM